MPWQEFLTVLVIHKGMEWKERNIKQEEEENNSLLKSYKAEFSNV